jgi:prepilin-type N-terminal cleavage/methylation domain-containing protein
MRNNQRRLSIRNPKSAIRNGFTLVEMLTVIGIIVLLVSILLPVVSAVRTKGHVADTQALLARIATGIESYYADFKAYPGPLHNGQIYNGGVAGPAITIVNAPPPPPGQPAPSFLPEKATQSENLVLGLLGGLKPNTSGAGYTFDWQQLGSGPMSLNPRAPKKHRAYMDKVNLSEGNYKDEAGDADDSDLPEFIDRFPYPMPILYMRANVGASGIVSNERSVTGTPTQEQYDLKQIKAYTLVESGKNIGMGKEPPPDSDYPNGQGPTNHLDRLKHGLREVTANTTIVNPAPPGLTYKFPYDLYGFMRHPSMANTPRQKDSYILISAGADRIYGTRDDAVYPAIR